MLILMCLMILILVLILLTASIRSLVAEPEWKQDYNRLINNNYNR